MDRAGALRRCFGGAQAVRDLPLDTRSALNSEKKDRISHYACQLMTNNSVIYIDSGSTTLFLARSFPKLSDVSVMTNSFRAVEPLASKTENLFFVGGQVDINAHETYGRWFEEFLSKVRIDVAFLGTNGFKLHTGPCSKTFVDASTKEQVIRSAHKVVVLADSSKFSSNALIQYADWSDIDVLVTDSDAPHNQVDIVRKSTEVVLV